MRHSKIYKHFYTQGRVDKSLVTEDIKGTVFIIILITLKAPNQKDFSLLKNYKNTRKISQIPILTCL